jgi:hypothetical protein
MPRVYLHDELADRLPNDDHHATRAKESALIRGGMHAAQ